MSHRDHDLTEAETSSTEPSPTDRRARRPSRRGGRIAGVVLIAGALAITATACSDDEGSGDLATLHVSDFVDPEVTGLKVLDDFDVRVTVDPSQPQSATFVIDDNLVDRGSAHVDDGVLTIGFDGFSDVEPSQTPIVELTVKRLESIENHSDSTITVSGVDGDELSVVNTDGGSIAVTGAVDEVDVRSTSDGVVDLSQLDARRVDLVDTDDGPIDVRATEVIEGSISGTGNVTDHGQPTSSDVDLDDDGQLLTAA
jgi:hypothetical protein